MYLCLCLALTERQVEEAARNGVRSSRELYRVLDAKPSCGKCVPYVQQTLRRSVTNETASMRKASSVG